MPIWPDKLFRLKRAVRDALGLLEEPAAWIGTDEDDEHYTITVIVPKDKANVIMKAGRDDEGID